jgi:hypothetical protein
MERVLTVTVQLNTRANAGRSALFGYAVLRANFNHSAPHYLDNFNAFVLDVLADRFPTAVDAANVGQAVRATFGFNIPDAVVGNLLRKLAKTGKVQVQSAGLYTITESAKSGLASLQESMAQFQARQSDLLSKFAAYISGEHPEGAQLLGSNPAQHLQSFIELNAGPLLRDGVAGQPGGSGSHWAELHGAEYLVASFILHLQDTDALAFSYVVDAVKGAILAGVLDVGAGELKRKLTNLTLILDTPILLTALGYQGDVRQRAAVQTLELARKLHAKTVCFEHTEKELQGVLESAIASMRSGGRSEGGLRAVDAHFRDIGASPADIVIEQDNLHRNLEALGLRVISRPDDYYKYGLDEATLEDLLKKQLPTQRESTRLYDLQSISAVHRLRKGTSPASLERCRYLFVTDNYGLTVVGRQVDERHEWPLAMLDGQIASLLWVRGPAVADDLPREQLLAAVYAGMQPDSHLWMKYIEEIERLEQRGALDPDDVVILRSRPEASRALMDVTLGQSDHVNSDSIEAIVDRVREELSTPYRVEADSAKAQRDRAEALAAAAAEAAADEAHAFNRREAELGRRVDDLHNRVAGFEDAKVEQEKRIVKRCQRRARRVVSGIALCLGVVLTTPVLVTTLASGAHLPGAFVVVATGAAAVLLILGSIGAITGSFVTAWLKPVEGWLARRFERRLRRSSGLSDDSNED